MPTDKNRTAYLNEYQRKHYKRIALNLKFNEYETLKAAADAAHEPINTYIKKAIRQRIESSSES